MREAKYAPHARSGETRIAGKASERVGVTPQPFSFIFVAVKEGRKDSCLLSHFH